MMKKSHAIIGTLGTVVLHPQASYPVLLLLVSGAFIGSILPDWDLRWKIPHRGPTHWLVWPAIFLWAGHAYPFMIGLCTGWFLHILADSMTVEGLRPLWPVTWRIHGLIRTGALLEYVLILPITAGLLYMIIK
jgi:membrane-bound metal-dependent hydrolase YbcI (DUF457 family)